MEYDVWINLLMYWLATGTAPSKVISQPSDIWSLFSIWEKNPFLSVVTWLCINDMKNISWHFKLEHIYDSLFLGYVAR